MAAIQYQPSPDALVSATISELQRELNDTWSQVQDAPGKAASLIRMENEVRRAGTCLQDVEQRIRHLEHFVTLVDRPGELSLDQLEEVVEMMAADKLPVDMAVKDLDKFSELVARLENLATQMEKTDKVAFRNLIVRLRQYASRWRDGLRRIETLEQRWQDGMMSMKVLGELGIRRPLTTEEKIRLTRVSVIHTPVIQEPSDNRADWYDDDGR